MNTTSRVSWGTVALGIACARHRTSPDGAPRRSAQNASLRASEERSRDARAWHAGASAWQGRENCNDYSIGIELEGLEGERFEPAQYAALARLLQAIAGRYPIDSVAGHEHVAPGRKVDPGPGFEWAALRAALGWPHVTFAQA